jgi:hypothetical protein
LGPATSVTSALQQLPEDVQADVDRRRQQAVAHMGCEDLELTFDLLGQRRGQGGSFEVGQPEAGHQSQVASRGNPGV